MSLTLGFARGASAAEKENLMITAHFQQNPLWPLEPFNLGSAALGFSHLYPVRQVTACMLNVDAHHKVWHICLR